jgi:cardiolipin synthase A/B
VSPQDRFAAVDTPGTPGGTSDGNLAQVIVGGDEAYARAHRDMESATERVWVETYILEPDEVGREFIRSMVVAARRGCDVRLVYDRWGSPKISQQHIKPLLDAGVKVAVYNPYLPNKKLGRKIGSIIHRDHRKILIADEAGYTGGRNISSDYGGPGPTIFFDLTLRIEGPAVRDLASVYADAYDAATGESLALPPAPSTRDNGIQVDVLELNQKAGHHDLDQTIRRVLRNATSRCLLVTPYFVPPQWFLDAILEMSGRGVDVKLLTAGKSDVEFARSAGRHLYGRLLSRGIRVFELTSPTLHAKFLSVDGEYGLIGSYNVDRYGAKHNLELGVGMHDKAVARRLEEIFDDCLGNSREVSMDDWSSRGPFQRVGHWMAHRLTSI